MIRPIVIGLATAGQYIVPLVCFLAAAMSAVKRQKRQEMLSNAAAAEAPDVLDGMTWQQFELLVGQAFRLEGYQVTETGGGGPDGGVDLVLRRGTEKFFVQCKQWKAFKVGVQVVRELYGVMAAKGAAGGFVVTSGRFTDEAKAFAEGRNVTLVDGPKLIRMIKQAKASLGGATSTESGRRIPEELVRASMPPASWAAQNAPACPVCSRPMTLRTAKRGANAGGTFWGCTEFPACRGVRDA